MNTLEKHTQQDILGQALIDLGLGTPVGANKMWPVFIGMEQDTPDNSLTIFGTAGTKDGRYQIDGETAEHYGAMVRVRSNNPNTVLLKATNLAYHIDTSIYDTRVKLGDTIYRIQTASKQGSVNNLGVDRNNSSRHLATINYLLSIYLEDE